MNWVESRKDKQNIQKSGPSGVPLWQIADQNVADIYIGTYQFISSKIKLTLQKYQNQDVVSYQIPL